VIPSDWYPYRRSDDGELLGWIRPHGEEFVPVTLLGHDLAEPSDWLQAEERLEARGLSWLAEPWTFTSADHGDIRVRIVDVRPDGIRIKTEDYGAIDVPVSYFELPFPAPTTLRPREPRRA
jgi:hypothetical protein